MRATGECVYREHRATPNIRETEALLLLLALLARSGTRDKHLHNLRHESWRNSPRQMVGPASTENKPDPTRNATSNNHADSTSGTNGIRSSNECCVRATRSTFEYLAVHSLPWANTLICFPGYPLPVQYQVTQFRRTPPQLVTTFQLVTSVVCCQVYRG